MIEKRDFYPQTIEHWYLDEPLFSQLQPGDKLEGVTNGAQTAVITDKHEPTLIFKSKNVGICLNQSKKHCALCVHADCKAAVK